MSFVDLPGSSWAELLSFIAQALKDERYADPKCLTRAGRKVYSQTDEDGVIAEIFSRIGISSHTFIEIGVEAGVECNSLWLLMQGWRGAWIEADEGCVYGIRASHHHWMETGRLRLLHRMATAENINEMIAEARLPAEIDFLSIDIDGNDYWVWKALNALNPRVVCIEYNASWPPPARLVVAYDAEAAWSRTNHFGASLSALASLGEAKGYRLVGCTLAGTNAFFVRGDLCGDLFYKPGSAETHYESPKYFLASLPAGHPNGVGRTVIV